MLLSFLPLEKYHLHIWDWFFFFEIVDISPGSLDSSLCFSQPNLLHDVFCICLISRVTICSLVILLSQFWTSLVPCPVLTVPSWPAYRFLRRQIRWSATPISLRIFQFVVIHTVKGLSIVKLNRSRCFSGTLSLSLWSNECWQFDLWFLCLF